MAQLLQNVLRFLSYHWLSSRILAAITSTKASLPWVLHIGSSHNAHPHKDAIGSSSPLRPSL